MRISTLFAAFLSLGLLWSCSPDAEEVPRIALDQEQQALTQQVIEETGRAIAAARQEAEQETVSDRSGNTVFLPAGSSDALEDAIAAAGPNGTVILRSGSHSESGTVMIPHRLNLIGEPGAVLTVNAGSANFTDLPVVLTAGLYVKEANNTRIEGLEIRPEGENGKVAILVEDSRRVRIAGNNFSGFQITIFLWGADNALLANNYIRGLQESERHYGVMATKGRSVTILENEIEQCGTGVFTSDRNGQVFENYFHDNQGDGIILCTVPAIYALPNGTTVGAQASTNGWLVAKNISNGNGELGYSIIDGAFNNRLINNSASDNSWMGMVLFGDLDFPGLFFPASKDNLVISTQQPDVTIMDCGENNTVIGGTPVDCFF